jgi:hypothetical protein
VAVSGAANNLRGHHGRPSIPPAQAPVHRFVAGDAPSEWWTASWTELTSVEFGPRSLILRVKGQRACRFVTMTRDRLLPLIDDVEARGIPVTPVNSTVGWFAKPS